MAETRIKVKVSELIGELRERRQTAIERYEADVARYEAEEAAYPGHVITALEDAIARVRAGVPLVIGRGGMMGDHLDVDINHDFLPQKPRKTADTTEVDRLIASLVLSTEDTLALTNSDLRYYLNAV